jgi:hypothetical protein
VFQNATDADLAAILAKIVEKAKAGDATAAWILLDRLVPMPRALTVTLDLPSLEASTPGSPHRCTTMWLRLATRRVNCGGFALPLADARRRQRRLANSQAMAN